MKNTASLLPCKLEKTPVTNLPMAGRKFRLQGFARCLLPLLLLAALFKWPQPVQGNGGTTVCAAVDSFTQLIDFFERNAAGLEADGYTALAFASLAARSQPSVIAANVAGECGDARLVEFQQTMARLDKLLEGFRSRASSSTAYDRETFRRICQPIETLVRQLLNPKAFHWRRLDDGDNTTGVGSKAAAAAWVAMFSPKLEAYNEKLGDTCYYSILEQKPTSCTPSQTCQQLFCSTKPLIGYALTHQLLYWTVAVDKSCDMRLSNGRPVDRSLLHDTCRKIYAEYLILLRAADFESSAGAAAGIDLAVEQAVLCGLLGYRDFFTDSTVLLLRRLQHPRLGCYGLLLGTEAETPRTRRSAVELADTGRRLLHDAVMEGTCSSHTSGLAAAYLMLYLHK